MDTNDFKCLKDLFELAELIIVKCNSGSHSGRQCIGIKTEGNVFTVLADLMEVITDRPNWHAPDDEMIEFSSVLSDAFRSARVDSWGKNGVIYFPDVLWPEDVPEKEPSACPKR